MKIIAVLLRRLPDDPGLEGLMLCFPLITNVVYML
jgi:hypothetical protein